MTGATLQQASGRPLMLVSAHITDASRAGVEAGLQPKPEYFALEARGVELLDWSRLPGSPRRRSILTSGLHVLAALPRLRGRPAVFSDGENVGLPLALSMKVAGVRTPHLMLGHHLTNGRKPQLIRRLRPERRIDRIIVHSPRQLELATRQLNLPAAKLALDPYHVDTTFWSPQPSVKDEPLIVAAGREHRDYACLVEAWSGRSERVYIAAASTHSPSATSRWPAQWPETFEVGAADPVHLRERYGRAAAIVVPVVESDFQAGITVVLEAMSMGKAVIATAARGWSGVIEDGIDGLLVPPGDAGALRTAISRVIDDEELRTRLGRRARESASQRFGLEAYCDRLMAHLDAVANSTWPSSAGLRRSRAR